MRGWAKILEEDHLRNVVKLDINHGITVFCHLNEQVVDVRKKGSTLFGRFGDGGAEDSVSDE